MGLYLSALFVCLVYAGYYNWLSLIALALIAGVPVMVYVMLKRAYVAGGCKSTFSELWTQGILTFLGGTVIMAAFSFVYLKWIEPTFMADMINAVIEMAREVNDENSVMMLKKVIDNHLVPTASDVAMEFVWLGTFSGSILSMLLALIVRSRNASK